MNNVNLQNLLLISISLLSLPILTDIKTNNSQQDTEADFVPYCPNCKQSNPLSSIPLNVRSCGLVSSSEDVKKARLKQSDISSVILSQQDIEKGKLSDYWAQELIGSDLLREEELRNIPPPERENFISVFDGSDIFHATPIKNLISDEGFQAVLPNQKYLYLKPDFQEITPL